MVSFIGIGLASYGGGLVTVGLIIHEIVTVRAWLSAEAMAQAVTLSQLTPGPVAINTATFTGYRVDGILGSIVATLSVVLPSIVLMSTLLIAKHKLRDKPGHPLSKAGPRITQALRPGLLALLLQAVFSFGSATMAGPFSYAVFGGSLVIFLVFRKLHPLIVMVGAGLLGVLLL